MNESGDMRTIKDVHALLAQSLLRISRLSKLSQNM